MTDRYAVIGNPIAHSKSPQIHAAFAAQTGEAIEYGRILGNPTRFAEEVRGFVAEGGRGLNVTVPFKTDAFELLEDLSERARLAGAVNTIIVRDGGLLRGDNTDGTGLIRDLSLNHGVQLQGKRILLLGAGGAARGVLKPLIDAGPQRIQIANRTAAKAEVLATMAEGPLHASGLEELSGQHYDLIINATSTGLSGAIPAVPEGCIADGGCVYDMLYADQPTPFCRWGMAQGARAIDGIGMLVEQAAESFWLWRGVRPDTAPVIALLRQPLPLPESG